MPQEIRVVQCFQCEMFQVDIVKKVNKWQCKVCNTKQSLRKELFRGSGAECRHTVQELNKQKSERVSQESNTVLNLLSEEDNVIDDAVFEEKSPNNSVSNSRKRVSVESNWKSFLDDPAMKNDVQDNPKQTATDSEEQLHRTQKRSKWDTYL